MRQAVGKFGLGMDSLSNAQSTASLYSAPKKQLDFRAGVVAGRNGNGNGRRGKWSLFLDPPLCIKIGRIIEWSCGPILSVFCRAAKSIIQAHSTTAITR